MVKLNVKSAAIPVVIAALTILAIVRSIAVAETTNLPPRVCSHFDSGSPSWNKKPMDRKLPQLALSAPATRLAPGVYETRPYAIMLKVPGPMHDDCMSKGPGATHDRAVIRGQLQPPIPAPKPNGGLSANPAGKNLPWYDYLTNDLGRAQSPGRSQNPQSPTPPPAPDNQ